MKNLFIITCMLLTFVSCKKEVKNSESTTSEEVKTSERIISLNGAITEIIAELGEEKNIVAVDITSNYPASLKQTTKTLGHLRSVNIESLLALNPTVIYLTHQDAKTNPNLIEQLKASKIRLEILSQELSIEGTKKLITEVAKSLNKNNYQALIDKISTKIATIQPLENAPKVLFIYARGAGTLFVGGKETPFDAMIKMAGAKNAAENITDFKPLTPEALVGANPDVILMFDSGLQSIGGLEGLQKIEGMSQTNAGKNKKVIAMEGQYLSGFGPRVADAVEELNKKLSQ